MDRLTVAGAIRFDLFQTSFPEQTLGPVALAPNRNLTFPAADNINWKDLTYRSGLSYDLFGTGKTAVKFSFNKYLLGQTLNGLGRDPEPGDRGRGGGADRVRGPTSIATSSRTAIWWS